MCQVSLGSAFCTPDPVVSEEASSSSISDLPPCSLFDSCLRPLPSTFATTSHPDSVPPESDPAYSDSMDWKHCD